MPKRLNDLKSLDQGQRQKAVIEAVQKIGMASINEVTKEVSRRFELDLTKENTLEAFRKSIRLDLKKMAGKFLGTAYYTRDPDTPTRVSEDELEQGTNRNVKNKYNIKYFVLGSDDSVPGGRLFEDIGGQFIPQLNSASDLTVDWEINSFKELKSDHVHIVFKSKNKDFICVTAPAEELPFKVLISRIGDHGDQPDLESLRKALGSRSAFISWPDRGISSCKKNLLGHILIDFHSSGSKVTLRDLGSTNGSLVADLNGSHIQKQLDISKQARTFLKEGNDDRIWKKIQVKDRESADTKQTIKDSDVQFLVSEAELPLSIKIGETEVLLFIK